MKLSCLLSYLYLHRVMCAFWVCFSREDKGLSSQVSHRTQLCLVQRVCVGTGLRFKEKIFELSIEM